MHKDDLDSFLPGPLALSLLALFGPGSFSKVAQSIKTADDAVSRTLCKSVPFHLAGWRDEMYQDTRVIGQDDDSFPSECTYTGWIRDPITHLRTDDKELAMIENWQDKYLRNLVARVGDSLHTPPEFGEGEGHSWLSMAMHVANQALLDIATSSSVIDRAMDPPRTEGATTIWYLPGLEYSKPSVSTAGVVVVSFFLGLQVLGILFLLGYIYSTPTWTDTLDSLAIARIAYQLPDEDQALLKKIGLRRARSSERKKLGAGGVEEEANSSLLPARDNVKEPEVSESTV